MSRGQLALALSSPVPWMQLSRRPSAIRRRLRSSVAVVAEFCFADFRFLWCIAYVATNFWLSPGSRQGLFVDHAAFHYERHVFRCADVRRRVALHGDHIRIQPGFQLPESILLPQDLRIHRGCRQ